MSERSTASESAPLAIWYQRFIATISRESITGDIREWDDEAEALCAVEVARFLSARSRDDDSPSFLIRQRIAQDRDREVQWLLRALVDFTSPDERGTTPLHLAVLTGNDAMVALLLEHFVFVAKGRLDDLLVKGLKKSRFLSNDVYLIAHEQIIGKPTEVQRDIFLSLSRAGTNLPKSLAAPQPQKGRFDKDSDENRVVAEQLRAYINVRETVDRPDQRVPGDFFVDDKKSAFDRAVDQWRRKDSSEHREIVRLLIRYGATPSTEQNTAAYQKSFRKDKRFERFATKCSKCERGTEQLFACSACSYTIYCGDECQRADWSHHQVLCSFLRSIE